MLVGLTLNWDERLAEKRTVRRVHFWTMAVLVGALEAQLCFSAR